MLNIIKQADPDKIQVAMLRAQSSLTVSQAVSQEHQISFLKRNDPLALEIIVSMMVEMLAEQFNVKSNFSTVQIMDCTLSIIQKFWYLRPEEILFAFKQAKMGVYGPAYNKLDTPTILEWLHKYDTEDRMVHVAKAVDDYKQEEKKPEIDIMAAYQKELQSQQENAGLPTVVVQSQKKKEAKFQADRKEMEFQQFQADYYKNRNQSTSNQQ